MITKLCQIVDTVKLHYYHTEEMEIKDYNNYLFFVNNLITLKSEAQLIHHSNNDMRYTNTKVGSDTFRVMATTFRGFSVTLRNQDVSLSFKTSKMSSSLDLNAKKDTKKHNHTHSPIIKAEFRASFLARVGHVSAMKYVNNLIQSYVINEFNIKVSELHLATDLQGYNFTELDFFRFKTLKKSNEKFIEDDKSNSIYYNGRKFTGFSFGKGDEMLRIYDKTVEIQKNPDKAFIKHLAWINNDEYKEDEKVWRIEIQYRRSKLKTLYTDTSSLLDGFQVVIDAIPDLWGRALEKIEHKDFDDEHCLDMLRGYSVKDGVLKLITNDAVTKRYQRAKTSDLWVFLNDWKGFTPQNTHVDKAPKTSAFQWVGNSIKSLLTTLLRYSGELSPRILEMAFVRCNEEIQKDKQITLIDNAYANTMDYVGNSKRYMQRNGVDYPINKLLEANLSAYVQEITIDLFGSKYHHERVTYLDKSLERMA